MKNKKEIYRIESTPLVKLGVKGKYLRDYSSFASILGHFAEKGGYKHENTILLNAYHTINIILKDGKRLKLKIITPIPKPAMARCLTLLYRMRPWQYNDKMKNQSVNPDYIEYLHAQNVLRRWREGTK